jgi:protein LTV1
MTSSALARTAPLTLLDDRFDKIENAYSMAEFPEEEEDDYNDAASLASGMSRVSKAYSTQSGLSGVSGVSSYSRAEDSEAPQLMRTDFDGIMDDFLGSHNKAGKFGKRIRKGKTLTGMQQWDEIRGQLGPARMKSGVRGEK